MSGVDKEKKEKKGIFASITRKKGLEKGDAGISFPTNFKHETHVTFDAATKKFKNLPPEWEKILNESGITAQEQESNAGTVIQVLNAAANIKTKGLGRQPRPPGGTVLNTMPSGTFASQSKRAPRRYMRALFEFRAEGQTHPCGYGAMNMRAGEVVTLIDDSFNDGWSLVQKSATEIGIVPALYVEKYTPPELRPGAPGPGPGRQGPGRGAPPTRQLARVSVAASAPVLRVPPPARGPPAAARAPVPAAVPPAPLSSDPNDALAQMRAMAEQMKKDSQPTLESVCDPGNPEDMYEGFQLCGEGASGSVYSANEKATGRVVAIKKMELARQPNEGVLHNEMSIMKKGSAHENIVTFFNAYLVDGFLWVAMELVDGGSLTEVLEHCTDIDVSQIALVLRDSLRAIEFLHSLDIVHRDIKSDNILLGVDGSIRLTDFGYAAQLTEHVSKRNTVVGTAWWMAPEVIDPAQQYGKQCDIWSFGVMSRECWEKEPPYMEESQTKALFLIMSKGLPPLDYRRPGMPMELQNVVNSCCVHDPNQRPLASALLQFPLFSMCADAMSLTPLAEFAKQKRAERAAAEAEQGEYDEQQEEEEWQPFSFGNNNNDEPPAPVAAPVAAPPPTRAPPPMAAPPPAAVSAPPPMRSAPPTRGLMGPPQHLADELPRGSYHAPPSRVAHGATVKRVMGAPSHLSEPEPVPAPVAAPPPAMAPPPSMLPPSRATHVPAGPRVMGPPAHLNGDDGPSSPRGPPPPGSPPPEEPAPTGRRALPTPVARRPPAAGGPGVPPPLGGSARTAPPVAAPAAGAPPAQGGRALPTPAARRVPGPPASGGPAAPPAPARRGALPSPTRKAASPAAAEAPAEPPEDDEYWSD